MSDYSDIYKLRTELESSIAATLTAQGFTVLTRANSPVEFQQVRPRLELKCKIGAATGHKAICPDGLTRYDTFRVSTAVQVISVPSSDGTNAAHEEYIGKVRASVDVLAQYSFDDSANYPNVYLATPMRDTGTADTLKTEEGIEYSVLTWDSIVAIRQSAWPS